ncbi:hypothetical protein P152DRAFT_345088 [Eremomyces bilateralis CBS 781.70]|uniref:Gag1-like clamp domain-containing protein n=1 Tax=Eremomyces bilateralis CBS 781.70 TaxID=1392243 RepID=A0A6G1G406_9PEZI|nr:uncharacterized protein P152DRAFT_345088 [Eremomyces bilateralis CBS 781.70]KAF1812650.1 hypothetical protein P152DRAFT_345088 [Eremomyces bilateralis CBS 781.70]
MELNLASPATREIRRFLYSAVQDDWEYPPKVADPSHPSDTNISSEPLPTNNVIPGEGPGSTSPPLAETFPHSTGSEAIEERVPLAYMERFYGSSDETDSGSERSTTGAKSDTQGIRVIQKLSRRSKHKTAKEKKDAFKFDSPDSIGAQIQARQKQRKRKREREWHEECEWNEGLDLWAKRRDAWTGAVVRPGPPKEVSTKSPEVTVNGNIIQSPSGAEDEQMSDQDVAELIQRLHSSSDGLTDTSPLSPQSTSAATDPDDPPTLLPVLYLIPPTFSPRQFIAPDSLLPIYRALVTNARTPSLPLPLPTVISACVAGWTDAGEWPPGATKPPVTASSIRGSLNLHIPVSPTPLSPGFAHRGPSSSIGGLGARPVPDGFFGSAKSGPANNRMAEIWRQKEAQRKEPERPKERRRRRSSLARLIGIPHDSPTAVAAAPEMPVAPSQSPPGPSPLSPHWVSRRGSAANFLGPGEGKEVNGKEAEERRVGHQSPMRKGVDSVKKVLRINTGGSPGGMAGEGSPGS